MFKKINSISLLTILLSVVQFSAAISQEWLFWPSNTQNGTLVVNSAENQSKIRNFKKSESLHLRYSITEELEKIVSPASSIFLNGKVASIDITYIAKEMQWDKDRRMDKNFMPLFGTYETGLHVAVTTNEDIKGREAVQSFLEDNCEFVNQLFQASGFSMGRQEDYAHFQNLIKMGQIHPRYFYLFLPDFTLTSVEGFTLYHIFGLGSKSQDLGLSCDFDVEAIAGWTSSYFKLVISRHSTLLNDRDRVDPPAEEGERQSTLMMKMEEILHLQFPETVECRVNQHLSEVKYIGRMEKTSNNAFSITTINPRGVKNDEIAFLPCPLPKVKFSYRLNPGVGLHPILFTTVEVDEWVENQPLVMLLTFDPNLFADEYQISDQPYDKNIRVQVLGHPDLEVAVNDPQAKFNYVKVVFDALAPKANNITLEIPIHVRYPESEPVTVDGLAAEEVKDVEKKNDREETKADKEQDQGSQGDQGNQGEETTVDPQRYKAIWIHPPRFYTTSTKLCHQEAYSSSNLPMHLLANAGKPANTQSQNKMSIIPVRVAPVVSASEASTSSSSLAAQTITPLRMDVPKGQLKDYARITWITTLITGSSMALLFLWTLKFSHFPSSSTATSTMTSATPKRSSSTSSSSKKTATTKKKN